MQANSNVATLASALHLALVQCQQKQQQLEAMQQAPSNQYAQPITYQPLIHQHHQQAQQQAYQQPGLQQQRQHIQQRLQVLQQSDPSLFAVCLVVKALLKLAALKASSAVAAQLKNQVVYELRDAALQAEAAGQQFNAAEVMKQMLLGLSAEVLEACGDAHIPFQHDVAAAASAAVRDAMAGTKDTAAGSNAAAPMAGLQRANSGSQQSLGDVALF